MKSKKLKSKAKAAPKKVSKAAVDSAMTVGGEALDACKVYSATNAQQLGVI